jgi:protein-L-isoaspartate(D-aspartate) O-methyltransferase
VQTQQRDRFAQARKRMVEEFLVKEGIKNERVLEAMRTVPRHLFVPENLRGAAYFDQALPIGHKQTISPPFIVAYMTEILDPQPEDIVLEVGTGSGYQAAVLSGLVAKVYTIEIVEALGRAADRRLHSMKYENIEVRVGDGYQGWPEHAPFDKIIVTCSPEEVPQPLIDQLQEGGKMIIPLGERYEQAFHLLEKKQGRLVRTQLLPVLFVPMTGISESARKVQPDPANPLVNNGGFEIDENEDGLADGWHYQRLLTRETKGAPEGQAYIRFSNDEAGRGSQLLQGMGLDGRKVSALQFSLRVKAVALKPGLHADEKPGLMVQFYDADRQNAGQEAIGPWQGSFDWKRVARQLHVPPKAREAIVRIGLNGGTGELCIDDVQMKSAPR